MPLLSTFEGTRRDRRRRALSRGFAWAAVLAAVAAAAAAGYRTGVSQGRTETERLQRDVAALQERNRTLNERVARAEQQAEAAIARAARLQRRLAAEVPQGELRRLVELAGERLRAGAPPERLALLLQEAVVQRRCARGVETKRVAVHTPRATSPVEPVAFAEGRVTVSAEGAAAPPAADGGAPGFDRERPVTLRFLDIEGDVGTASGRLPLTHALVQGEEEFLFLARAGEQPGEIELTSQRCSLP